MPPCLLNFMLHVSTVTPDFMLGSPNYFENPGPSNEGKLFIHASDINEKFLNWKGTDK